MVHRPPWAMIALAAVALAHAAACGGSEFTTASEAGAPDAHAPPVEACVPKLCPELRWACGSGDDGCGHNLDCGQCVEASTICDSATHKCVCHGKTCTSLGFNCGSIGDGCGNDLLCGACPATQTCGGGGDHKCGTNPCVAKTCAAGQCGPITDGCGGVLDCGNCTSPETCGGGGTPNRCGCTSDTCSGLGWECGTGQDNCGKTIDCGGCDGGLCTNHSCTACVSSQTCASMGYRCGSFVDDCGQVQICGLTPAPVPPTMLVVCPVNGGSPYACCGPSGSSCNPQPGATPPEPTWGCTASGTHDVWCCTSTK